jgi:uncharacterized protein (TIGR00251 family)
MYLKIKVIPEAKDEKVEQIKDDEYRIWVKVEAKNNRANERILEILREMFPKNPVRIISGHHSPSKIVSIG